MEKNKRYYQQFKLDIEANNLLTDIKEGAQSLKKFQRIPLDEVLDENQIETISTVHSEELDWVRVIGLRFYSKIKRHALEHSKKREKIVRLKQRVEELDRKVNSVADQNWWPLRNLSTLSLFEGWNKMDEQIELRKTHLQPSAKLVGLS